MTLILWRYEYRSVLLIRLPRIENPALSKSCSTKNGTCSFALNSSRRRRDATTDCPLVDMKPRS